MEVLLRVSVPPKSLSSAEYIVFEKVIEMPAPPVPGMEIYMFSEECGWSLTVCAEGSRAAGNRLIWDVTNKRYVVEHIFVWDQDRENHARKMLSLGFQELKP